MIKTFGTTVVYHNFDTKNIIFVPFSVAVCSDDDVYNDPSVC